MPTPWITAAVCGCLTLSLAAGAQEARVSGTVSDSAGRPIAHVQLSFTPNGAQTFTDSAGHFTLAPLHVGSYRLTIRRVGFRPQYGEADVRRAGDITLAITMTPLSAEGVKVEGMTVRAEAPTTPDLAGFYERRAAGFGEFITPRQLADRVDLPLSNALRVYARRFKYVQRACSDGYAVQALDATSSLLGSKEAPLRSAGACAMPQACYAQIFVDGVRVYWYDHTTLPPDIDEFVVSSIEAVEIYHGGGGTPAQFAGPGSQCGTIVLWTKH